MQLARAAAAKSLADKTEPEPPPASEPPPIPAAEPQSDRETAPPPNRAPTPHRAAGTSSYKPTDPALLFTRLAATVRDCIALEARLAAGSGPTTRAVTLQLRADPRRAPLREAFRDAIKNHPDRADLLRESTTRLDEQLTNDPDQTIGLGTLLFTICEELGIEVDLAQISDEFLTSYVEPTDPNEDVSNAPYPRATSPP